MPKMTLQEAQANWANVTPNFDIIEDANGVKGKLAGFKDGEPVVVWAKNGLGFGDLSKQVKLIQERDNLEKHMNIDEFNIDAPQPQAQAKPQQTDEFNLNAQPQAKGNGGMNEFNPNVAQQAVPKKGPKKDRFKPTFKITRPDADKVQENPNALLLTKIDINIMDKQTDKAAASTSLELRALTIPGVVEAALIGFQTLFNTMTRHKAPEERINILREALQKAASGDVSAFRPGKRGTRARKPRQPRGYPLAVQAISMVRGIDMRRVNELWSNLSDAHREQLFNPNHPGHSPEQQAQAQAYVARLAQLQQSQADAAPVNEQDAFAQLL